MFVQGCERREAVRYRVYLWLRRSSQAADVVQEVQALSASSAVQTVMRSNMLSFVFYAWVVPYDDALPCVECYQMRRASVQ
jgi:hypothetical protein